jgi:hypothetical protein
MARVPMTPYFENTTQEAYYNNDNELRSYFIEAVEGYVLHDNRFDERVVDPETGEETGEIILGYASGSISVGYNYDFAANPRQIYAVPRDSVDENYIFGGVNNDHEVM